MTLRTKLLIDRTLFRPLAHLLGLVVFVLRALRRRDHAPLREDAVQPTIVISKLIGMGSILNAIVLVQTLRRHHPDARIVFVTSRANRPLMELIPAIDRPLYLDDRGPVPMLFSLLRAAWFLWRARVDSYLDLEIYSSFSSILSALSLARNRLGFYNRSVSFRRYLFTHVLFFNLERNIREMYMNLAKLASAAVRRHAHVGAELAALPELRIPFAARTEATEVLARHGLDPDRTVLVNIHASDLCLERRWGIERWTPFLLEFLRRHPRRQVLLCGTADERGYSQELLDELQRGCPERARRVQNLAGELSLPAYLEVIRRAGHMITSDSGPYHFALALGAKTVSLWGPVNPNHYAWRRAETTIRGNTYCSPCLRQSDVPPCEGAAYCMKLIAVERVLDEVEARFFGPEAGYRGVEIAEESEPMLLGQVLSPFLDLEGSKRCAA